MSTTAAAPKGLQDVVANESSICFIDGARGILSYRGIDIHELAEKSTFEETAYLLWNGALPKKRRAASLCRPARRRAPPARARPRVPEDPARRRLPHGGPPAPPSPCSRSTIPTRNPPPAKPTSAKASTSPRRSPCWLPSSIACARAKGSSKPTPRSPTPPTFSGCSPAPSPPKPPQKHSTSRSPSTPDHELNASTFAARVIAATLSDMHSAITGAIGALKGPLHGGANEAVMALPLPGRGLGRRPRRTRPRHARRQGKNLRLRPPCLHH